MVGEVWGTLCQVKGANEAVWGEALPSTARTPAGTWLGKGAPEVPVPPLHGRIRPCPFSVPFPDGTQMLSPPSLSPLKPTVQTTRLGWTHRAALLRLQGFKSRGETETKETQRNKENSPESALAAPLGRTHRAQHPRVPGTR